MEGKRSNEAADTLAPFPSRRNATIVSDLSAHVDSNEYWLSRWPIGFSTTLLGTGLISRFT
jgi:hypothetical protein